MNEEEKEKFINRIEKLRRKKVDEINEKLKEYYQLIDEFDYEKNGIELTKEFIKYLLFDIYWKLTKKGD